MIITNIGLHHYCHEKKSNAKVTKINNFFFFSIIIVILVVVGSIQIIINLLLITNICNILPKNVTRENIM